MKSPKFIHGGPFFRGVHVLVVGLKGFVIADVAEAFVANHADDVVAFIHAIPGSVDVVTRFRQSRSEKWLSLHMFRHF